MRVLLFSGMSSLPQSSPQPSSHPLDPTVPGAVGGTSFTGEPVGGWGKGLCQKAGEGLSGGSAVKNPPANAGDMGSSPGLRRSYTPRDNTAHEPQLPSLSRNCRSPRALEPVLCTLKTTAVSPQHHT